jgi:ankyrin repeat protein
MIHLSGQSCSIWDNATDSFQYLLSFYKDDLTYMNNIFRDALSVGDENISLVEQLIIGGCDANTRFEEGITPLVYAAMKGHSKTIQVLVEAGADINLSDDRGRTPLLWAIYHEIQEIIDYLVPLTDQKINNMVD